MDAIIAERALAIPATAGLLHPNCLISWSLPEQGDGVRRDRNLAPWRDRFHSCHLSVKPKASTLKYFQEAANMRGFCSMSKIGDRVLR